MLAEQRAAVLRGESIAVVAQSVLERTGYVEKLREEDTPDGVLEQAVRAYVRLVGKVIDFTGRRA